MSRIVFIAVLLALSLTTLLRASLAHEVRPALLQLTEVYDGHFSALWRVPARGERMLSLHPTPPRNCQTSGAPQLRLDGMRAETTAEWICDGGLAGREITIAGLEGVRTDALIRISYINGGSETLRASPTNPTVVPAGHRDLLEIASAYLVLGIEHILLGFDHLLFVTVLLLLISDWRRLVATVTAFTIAHTMTLTAAALGLVNVPPSLMEALIALSIAVVAAEVVRKHRGKFSLSIRYPWIVAFVFGLLHGFGFAGALEAIGLPSEAIPTALLFFNLGVEAGQLLFIGALVIAAKAVQLLQTRQAEWLRPGLAYGIGILAMFWTAERAAAIWL